MPREVIKRVGTRAYRYRVESYRDGAKVRARWTYLGVVDLAHEAIAANGSPPSPAPSARQPRDAARTRERLVDAFERLAEREAYATITAGAVAGEAGLAHGTFYRYFTNKRGVLVAALDRIREAFDRVRPSFEAPFGELAAERARVRAWTSALGTLPTARGVLHAWYDAVAGDPELETARRGRLAERIAALASYLAALAARGTIVAIEPLGLATALTTLVDAVVRAAVVSETLPDEEMLRGLCDLFDRAIFQADR